MAIKGKVGGGGNVNYEPVPEGNHVARVYRIIHVGTIQENYMGEEKLNNKVQIGWELPNETKVFKEGEEAQPLSITQEYTLSMHEKANLRKVVTGVIGTTLNDEEAGNFDIVDLMGKTCMLNVVHKTSKVSGNVYAKVEGASPMPKGLEAPDGVNDPVLLDYEENWNQELFDGLAEWTQDKLKSSNEWKAKFMTSEDIAIAQRKLKNEAEIKSEDIPF